MLLVSDTSPYSTFDVYKGYCEGCQNLGVPYETANIVDLLGNFSAENAMGLLLSKMLIKENAFTHILFIAGTMIPRWVLESGYDKKICIVATDDPQASKMLLANKDVLDYYFTNEITMANDNAGMHYIPTGCMDFHLDASNKPKDDRYASDVCFIGSVYPNRVAPLQNALKWCIKNKKKMNLLGPIQGRTSYGELFVPEKSIIYKYGRNMILSNEEVTLYHANAKVVINLDRDVNWSPAFTKGNPHVVNCVPQSCNPRVYEVAAIKSTQLYVEPRVEAAELFDDNMYYSSVDGVSDKLDEIFKTPEEVLEEKKNNCYEIVKKSHTYTHRVAKVIESFIKY
jgi:hypothetical protein